MSIASKTRSTARRGVKIQRRIAITQALFWPVLLGTGVVIGAVVLSARRRSHRTTTSAAADTSTTPVGGPAESNAGLEPATD